MINLIMFQRGNLLKKTSYTTPRKRKSLSSKLKFMTGASQTIPCSFHLTDHKLLFWLPKNQRKSTLTLQCP